VLVRSCALPCTGLAFRRESLTRPLTGSSGGKESPQTPSTSGVLDMAIVNIYTGVGARTTPADELEFMTRLARRLAVNHWALRSGGAKGADTAFAEGAGLACIYRPEDATEAAMELAAKHHPAWGKCSPVARRMHGRNCFQVLGPKLDSPSAMLICWTKDGMGRGGTGQAIRIARAYDVPVFDLGGNRAEAIIGIKAIVDAANR